MMRHLKAAGLSLLAILALGAVVAQGAWASEKEHEFHSDGPKTIATGSNKIVVSDGAGGTKEETNVHTFKVGEAGTVACTEVQGEATNTSTEVSAETYKSDSLTATFHLGGCTYGGQPATWKGNHCAFVFDSDTTTGNPTGGEHANVEIECSEGSLIEVETSVCTITIGPQTSKHAFRYENDPHSKNAIMLVATAHKVKIGKKGAGVGCLLFPTGEIGTYVGTATGACYRDDGSPLEGTAKTTPTGSTEEGPGTECKVSNL